VSNLFKSHDRAALNAMIALPTPENIPVKPIAEAVDALMIADDRLRRARQTVHASESAVSVANTADARRVAEAIREGIDPSDPAQFPNPSELADIARDAVSKARGVLPTYEAMYREAFGAVTVAVAENGIEWSTASARSLDSAVNGLVATARKLQSLAADIEANYGVVELATSGQKYQNSGVAVFSIEDGRVVVPLSEAVSSIHKAVALVAERIELAKAAHDAKVAAE